MKDIILQKLSELEETEGINILYACESGSRAWGFASIESDYDVRFIYSRKIEQYLCLQELPDVVGLPVNEILDIGGWDIKKALKLFHKSNSALLEWLQSPIVYKQNTSFVNELHELIPHYFSSGISANHYFSMASKTVSDDLQGEMVKLKKYFYALRPALSCLWIIENQSVPPMEFEKLRILISNDEIQKSIDDLLLKKKSSMEKELIVPVKMLNEWLNDTLRYSSEKLALLPMEKKNQEALDHLFRKYIYA